MLNFIETLNIVTNGSERKLKVKNGDGNIVYEVPIKDFIRKGHARTFLAGDYQLILKDVSGEYLYRIEVSQQNNGCKIIAFFHYILYLLCLSLQADEELRVVTDSENDIIGCQSLYEENIIQDINFFNETREPCMDFKKHMIHQV